jgi:hypothetical protein
VSLFKSIGKAFHSATHAVGSALSHAAKDVGKAAGHIVDTFSKVGGGLLGPLGGLLGGGPVGLLGSLFGGIADGGKLPLPGKLGGLLGNLPGLIQKGLGALARPHGAGQAGGGGGIGGMIGKALGLVGQLLGQGGSPAGMVPGIGTPDTGTRVIGGQGGGNPGALSGRSLGDVMVTPSPGGPIPIPYPNVSQGIIVAQPAAGEDAAGAFPAGPGASSLAEAAGKVFEQLDSVERRIGSLSPDDHDYAQQVMLLQQKMSRVQRLMETATNMMRAQQDVASQIVQNLK